MLDKIAKLLNQAENAGTPEESKVFMEKAQKLADIHSISLGKARLHTEAKQRTVPIQKTIKIADSGTRGLKTLTALFTAVAGPNGVKLLYSPNGSYVYAYGYKEDIEIAESFYASLLTQQARALELFRERGDWQHEKVYIEGYYQYVDYDGKPCRKAEAYDHEWVDGKWKNQTWLTARVNFQEAYASQISRRLWQAKREQDEKLIEEEEANENSDEISTSLVLASKREEVEKLYRPKADKAGVYETHSSSTTSYTGRQAGRAAADQANLGPSTAIGGVKGAIER